MFPQEQLVYSAMEFLLLSVHITPMYYTMKLKHSTIGTQSKPFDWRGTYLAYLSKGIPSVIFEPLSPL